MARQSGLNRTAVSRIRRGTCTSVTELEPALQSWIADYNEDPRPLVWTKSAEEIFAAITAYLHRISDSEH
ncbi:hypothetical protein HDA32_000044 [Spinactinospora alkalitolerans]|uniref:Transposase n=1 Tax=Spinactinospora alkalitolerans TaxID=687207 RepID=A0A852TRX4_9ACTN|nr:hypothetical protein [Spinactinospora alkalitolerans]NYE44924.1 hypothetical protein [Spinactinospora alkalitolerans]